MDLEQKYKEETGFSVGEIHEIGTTYYSDDYVKWLEEKLSILRVNNPYFLFSGQEDGNPKKYLVDDCDDRETAIAKMETEYPNFKWVITETFNAC